MEVPSVLELDTLKYSELQKLAKQAGLKANLKADRLLKALKKHFHPDALPEQMSEDSDGSCTLSDKDESQSCEVKEELACHVTDRRGQRNKKIQNKLISTVISLEADEHDQAKQVPKCEEIQENNNEEDEESARPGSARRQRKRQRPKDVISEKKKLGQTGNSPPATKIPRHTGRLSKAGSKSSTPNFSSLHEAHFKKMESIDKYMERKQKRLDAVSSSIDEVKIMAMKSNLLTQAEKTPISSSKKLLQSKFFILSPTTQKGLDFPAQTPASQRQSARCSTASRSILANKSEKRVLVQSVSKMNVRFSKTTKDNEHKQSLIKTPARKSSCFKTPDHESRGSLSIQKKEHVLDANESLLCGSDLNSEASEISLHKEESEENNMNPSATTPFKFTAQPATTPNTNKKLRFDLQASLSRPLGYQPYKGKLKPWGQAKENQAVTSTTVSAIKNNFKQPILPTRDERRKKHEEDRKVKRDKAVGTRRGIVTQ
ncbi:PREDICTED: nucleolar and spindle-associated protein 1 [Nanorana parkeri]|uniref:nucleolar and spindle-associated protein 1 n=1 Tax=Nanorana parkeri TaxID=125878 RepID=UPI00085490DF|nr:PREDICTED: nucleolar and spindle-associated protein 1 [Nanorana parkeri]